MIAYLDTSALVKRYIDEEGSSDVARLINNAEAVAVSHCAYAEAVAAFYRKYRDTSISKKELEIICTRLKRDWGGFVRMHVSEDLHRHLDLLISRYPLRGFDAIHLASALLLRQATAEEICFACYDARLNNAAAKERLGVLA